MLLQSILLGAWAVATAAAPHEQFVSDRHRIRNTKVPGVVFDRMVTVFLENTDFDKAIGDPSLAALAKEGITLTNYFGLTHVSQPNYLGAIAGDNFGLDNDNFTRVSSKVSTVIDLLEDQNIPWSIYAEHMPSVGFQGMAYVNPKTHANDYVRKHNPVVICDANLTPARLANQKPLTHFYDDLSAHNLPQWAMVIPNMTSDGHDTSVATAGLWTKNFLTPLLANEHFNEKTVVLVVFDENHTFTASNRVLAILLGSAIPANLRGTTDSRFYNHYSAISTVEANWNLHTLGRFDVTANVFNLVAQKTGDIYRPNYEATSSHPTRFYNTSFAGPLNVKFEPGPYPPPNVDLVSTKTGRTVLPAIVARWGRQKSYYQSNMVVPDGQHPPPGYDRNPA